MIYEQTMEDKIFGQDLEDRLLELEHNEGYESQKDYEESGGIE